MKRLLSILLSVILLLAFCPSCFADAGAPITGEYVLFAYDVLGQKTDPAVFGVSASIVLNEDHTGLMISNGTQEELPNWVEGDGCVTLYNSRGDEQVVELRDGVMAMELSPGYYLYLARDGVDTAAFELWEHATGSKLYELFKSIDVTNGAHLSYNYHSDYMDSLSVFDVHARDGVFFSLRTTKVDNYEQRTANCFKDGKSYVLYPDEMRGNLAMATSSGLITSNVLMLDDLYSEFYKRAFRTDYTVETREYEGVSYQAEVFPTQDYTPEAAFYYNDEGALRYILVEPSELAPTLGQTFYTIDSIDEAVDDALFDISGYSITE